MQYAAKKIGEHGKVFGVDLKAAEIKLPNAIFVQGDINELNFEILFEKYGLQQKFNVVMSDMAPNTTSNRFTDQARSYDLSMRALATAQKFLIVGGNFICKIFDGEDAMGFRDSVRGLFKDVAIVRPKSTRDSSKEIFVVGKSFFQTQ